MLPFKKMLVPTDSSAGAEAALHLASYLRGKVGGRLLVAHVAKTEDMAAEFDREFLERSGPLPVDGSMSMLSFTNDRPADAIPRLASDEDVDLIVMGKHGYRTTDRLLTYLGSYGQSMGSTSEYVVRTSTAPVLLASPRFVHGPVDIRRVLVAIDFSRYTPAAIRLGRELKETFDADVEYLHVRERATVAQVDAAVDSNNGLPDDFSVERGSADRVILDHIAQRGIDLLAIHSHGTTGDRRARIGHVAEKLIQAAPCSILTMKSFGTSLIAPDQSDRELVARMRRRAGIA